MLNDTATLIPDLIAEFRPGATKTPLFERIPTPASEKTDD